MRILRVEIDGFKSKSNKVRVDFKNNISIIYGTNGTGKTTFLRILQSVLAQNDQDLLKERVQHVRIVLEYNNSIGEINVPLKYDESGYNWNELLESPLSDSKSIFIGLQRGIPLSYNRIPPSLIFEFMLYSNISKDILEIKSKDRNKVRLFADELATFINRYRDNNRNSEKLIPRGRHIIMDNIRMDVIQSELIKSYLLVKSKISTKILSALFETFEDAIDNTIDSRDALPPNIRDIIIVNKDNLIETLENTPDNGFKDIIVDKIQRIDYSYSLNPLLENLLYKIILELENEEEELRSLNDILEIFNIFLGKDKKIIINKDGVSIKCLGNTHTINELSSGERHLLSLIVTLYLDDGKRDFVFIDEPEISLNVLWQENLLNIISKIAPKAHLIVASHSPSVAENHLESLSKIINY